MELLFRAGGIVVIATLSVGWIRGNGSNRVLRAMGDEKPEGTLRERLLLAVGFVSALFAAAVVALGGRYALTALAVLLGVSLAVWIGMYVYLPHVATEAAKQPLTLRRFLMYVAAWIGGQSFVAAAFWVWQQV